MLVIAPDEQICPQFGASKCIVMVQMCHKEFQIYSRYNRLTKWQKVIYSNLDCININLMSLHLLLKMCQYYMFNIMCFLASVVQKTMHTYIESEFSIILCLFS